MSNAAEKVGQALITGLGTLAATIALIGITSFAGAFPIMIALGILHAEVNEAIPALGFWPTMGISWGLGALIGKFKKIGGTK